jgi:hypothetical protein
MLRHHYSVVRQRLARFVCASACVFAISGFALTALADGPDVKLSILIQEGDPMPNGDGTVGIVNDISINNNGDWIADVNVVGGTTARAIIKNGQVWLANGDPIDPDDTVSSVANLLKALNNNGDVVFRPSLTNNNSGVYLNLNLLLLHSENSTAPQFSEDTPYIGFFRGRPTDDGTVFAIVTVNDSETPGTVNRAIVVLTKDPKTGDVTEDALMWQHAPAFGTEEGVTFNQVNSNAENFSVSNNGDVIYSVPFLGSPTETNGGIYINDVLVARKGDASPIKGSEYSNIGASAVRVDVNDNGDYIFLCQLTNQPTATNMGIFRNNMFTDGPDELAVQRGDPVPGIPDETIESFGTGVQPHVTNNGDVVWYARFTGDTATNQGIFVNDQLIIQKGVTTVDGNLLTTVAGTVAASNGLTQGMVVSDDGRYVLIRAQFANGNRAAVLAELVQDECIPADLNCDGVVDGADLLILLSEWGPCKDPMNCPADLNGDQVVDGADLLILLASWGEY